jgi:hypothetical protein
MPRLPQVRNPRIGLGVASLTLATIGLMLFLLPILSVPITAAAFAVGVVGVVVSFWGGGASLRWSLAGVVLAMVAGAINLAIASGPAGYVQGYDVPPIWRPSPGPPYVSPPARPGDSIYLPGDSP